MMDIQWDFNTGDKVWVISSKRNKGNVLVWELLEEQLTIGEIQITYTNSEGFDDTIFDNYKSKSRFEVRYMCVETGIGSGTVYYEQNLWHKRDSALKEIGKREALGINPSEMNYNYLEGSE